MAQKDEQTKQDERTTRQGNATRAASDGMEALLASPTMARLIDDMRAGTDIGHYGRLTFVMVGQRFLSDDEMLDLLARQPDHDEREMRALILRTRERDYNPPRRERLLEWQSRQDYPLIAHADDPSAGNLYRELQFPDDVYENIEEYYEEQVEAQGEKPDEANA